MVKKGAEESLPFDVAGIRTVIYDVSSPRAARESVRRLQEFIDSMVSAGFKTATSGESLSSIAQGIERIERKINQILSTEASVSRSQGKDEEEDEIVELLKSPREAFLSALRRRQLDKAFAMLDKLKRVLPSDEYTTSLVILVSSGHAKAFERLDSELVALLSKPAAVSERDELLQNMVSGAKKYFENTGQEKEGLKYLEQLYGRIVGNAEFTDETKAMVANQLGMLSWTADNFDLCLKYSKLAISLSESASYYYNLALVCEKKGMDQELQDVLKRLSQLPELDEDHRGMLVRFGYQPPLS